MFTFQILLYLTRMTIADISSMSRYVSPINPAVFPHLTVVLLGIGLFFTAWFFVYEVRTFLHSFNHSSQNNENASSPKCIGSKFWTII